MLPMTQPQRELTMALEWTGALKHLSFHQLRQVQFFYMYNIIELLFYL